ncbi:MAG: HD domain-containing protein [Planctomycetes bacterium]|nr:HD domain-containing protein [Planctomycetota bacterium]
MWHSGIRVVQDPVHGLMKFERREAFIIDLLRAAEVQRLRRIKQLGFACFVFPGVEHSRFTHALGTAYIAAQVGRHLDSVARELLPESLRPDVHALQDLCVAGLCHDLGHGPFSHVWERVVIGENWDKQAWAIALNIEDTALKAHDFNKWHEMVTYALLTAPSGQLHTLLEQNAVGSAARVAGLLYGHYYLPYMCKLISGDIDIDRLDYVSRDAVMAGLPSCTVQLDRLIACLTFGYDKSRHPWVGLNERKGLPVAVELMTSRAQLHEVLYLHKTILGMEWLLGNLLLRLRDLARDGKELSTGGVLPDGVLEMIRSKPVSLDQVMALDDHAIWMLVQKIKEVAHGDPTAVALGKRIMERDPLRAVSIGGEKVQAFFADRANSKAVEAVVAKFVEGEPLYFYKEFPVSFTVWEQDTKAMAYLVGDEETPELRFLSAHPRLRHLFSDNERSLGTRLFVPRESLREVEQLISRKS